MISLNQINLEQKYISGQLKEQKARKRKEMLEKKQGVLL